MDSGTNLGLTPSFLPFPSCIILGRLLCVRSLICKLGDIYIYHIVHAMLSVWYYYDV